jgi:hypothetical protein
MFKTHSAWRPFFWCKGFKGFFGILIKEENFILKPSKKKENSFLKPSKKKKIAF